MKLKAVVTGISPDEFIKELNRLRKVILEKVLVPFLKVPPNFGPAEFYVQNCDEADGESHAFFCEARLSGVSGPTSNRKRSIQDYHDALATLETIYTDVIERNFPMGSWVQLLVSIMLNEPIDGSTLIETEPKWIKGRK